MYAGMAVRSLCVQLPTAHLPFVSGALLKFSHSHYFCKLLRLTFN